MDEQQRRQIISEWVDSTEMAVFELRNWLAWLQAWQSEGGETAPGEFAKVFDRLYQSGLGDTWADTNPAGGGLDALAEAVKGGEL